MNNGWSEYHHGKAMNEIDKLQRKLDGIKQDFEASTAQQRAGQTFKRIVDRLPACGNKHGMVGPDDTPEQIGGS